MFLPQFHDAFLHIFLLIVSALAALMEIEIEGKHGFAKKLPTWKRDILWYRRFSNGKILTGYHVYLNLLLLSLLHSAFLFGEWTLQRELIILSAFFLYIPFWDFLWFALNPAFGWRRFRPENIEWFAKWYGPFPLDYYMTIGMSGILAFAEAIFAPSNDPAASTRLIAGFESLYSWFASVLLFLVVPVVLITLIMHHRRRPKSVLAAARRYAHL